MATELAQHPLSIPEQSLRTLSFCEPAPRHLQQWLSQLPMANLGDASRQLYHAIIELNKLVIDAETRVKLLELIYLPTENIVNNLKKHYLNQPLVLPGKARKVVRLCNAMNFHLAVGYKIALKEMSASSNQLLQRKVKKSASIALHRGISILSEVVLRSSQLYMPVPSKTWREIHQFYLIAESNKLQSSAIDCPANLYNKNPTISDCYKKVLLLSCCRTNQMRQLDIGKVYDAIELWTAHTEIKARTPSCRFYANLDSDTAPVYAELAKDDQITPFYRWLDLTPLLSAFKARQSEANSDQGAFVKGITVPDAITPALMNFLTSNWSGMKTRAFARVPNSQNIQICIGFTSTHFFLSGGVNFEQQMLHSGDTMNLDQHKEAEDHFAAKDITNLVDSSDVWSSGFDVEKFSKERLPEEDAINFQSISASSQPAAADPRFDQCTARLVNSSPNGYCVVWKDDLPPGINTGQIIGINEDNSNSWSLGVIRWINRGNNDEVLIGLELLAINAVPCGAKVVTKEKRRSDYMRAFLLPGHSAADNSASLITPNLPFKPGSKVILNQYGEISHGKIGQAISNTSSFCQFIYQADLARDLHDDSDDNLEDIWPDI